MSVYQSNKLINALQEQTDNLLNKAISEWQMLPHSQFGYKTAPEKWSALQCIEHLNSYGRYYLPQIEKAIAKAKAASITATENFQPGWLGNYFTQLMQPKADGSLGKKMASPKGHYPTSNTNSYLVIATFIEQQEQLLQLLDAAREVSLAKATVPISIAPFIRLKLGDTFRFLIAHEERHVLQAEQMLAVAAERRLPFAVV